MFYQRYAVIHFLRAARLDCNRQRNDLYNAAFQKNRIVERNVARIFKNAYGALRNFIYRFADFRYRSRRL